MGKPKRATLDDIAQAAGVSTGTVSKALNNRSDIAPDTRERVLQAARSLGYSKSTTAPPHVPLISFVTDTLASTYTLEILKGASAEAIRQGISLAVSYSHLSQEYLATSLIPLSQPWIDKVAAEKHLGVITVTSPVSNELTQRLRLAHLPHIAIDPSTQPPAGTLSIGATNWNGGRDATQHLIDLGHQRIAFIRGGEHSVPSAERLEGYLSALRSNGIHVNDALITGDGFTCEHGLRYGRELLQLPEHVRPTAIFAANDSIAIGVYQAARECGLSIPGDLSVVGFDDSDSSRWASPSLTTVHQPLFEMGARSILSLLNLQADSPSGPISPIRLTTHLVRRESTAPPTTTH